MYMHTNSKYINKHMYGVCYENVQKTPHILSVPIAKKKDCLAVVKISRAGKNSFVDRGLQSRGTTRAFKVLCVFV